MNGSTRARLSRLALAGAAVLTLASCSAKTIPATESDAKARWAEVEAAFRARALLVPDLSAAVQNAPDDEREVLSKVIDARARALFVHVAPGDLDEPVAMDAYVQAQGQLSAEINHLIASADTYPDLETVVSPGTLQQQVQAAEVRANEAIRAYSSAAKLYNATITSFPNVVVAEVVYGAAPMVIWNNSDPGPAR